MRAEVLGDIAADSFAQEDIALLAAILRSALAEEEVCKGQKLNVAATRARIMEVELLLFEIETSSDAVLAVVPGHLVRELQGVHSRARKVIEPPTKTEKRIDDSDGQFGKARVAGSDTERGIGDGGLAVENAGVTDNRAETLVEEVGCKRRCKFQRGNVVGKYSIEGESRRASGTAAAKGIVLWVTGVEEAFTKAVLGRNLIIDIGKNLIFSVFSRDAED